MGSAHSPSSLSAGPVDLCFCSTVYGKPVLPAGGSHAAGSDDADGSCPGGSEGAERTSPRPLSPTKLLPFLSNPHRSPSDADLEALRRRLHHAPRPLKKRSSITEPEGPSGPNIQKLLYQKTTLAAMETIPMETAAAAASQPGDGGAPGLDGDESPDDLTPPPLLPRSPLPPGRSLPPPPEDKEGGDVFPPYPPPPYPGCGGGDAVEAPEVTGQVAAPPVSPDTWSRAASACVC